MKSEYDLDRFVKAQDPVYDRVLAELDAGARKTHWMWFIFPQLVGLGQSMRSAFYGLADREEAAAYLAHPVLGPRLIECTGLVLQHALDWRDAQEMFGDPDDLKFQACVTLFSRAKPTDPIFQRAIDQVYGGVGCQPTLGMLRLAYIASLDED